MASVVLEGVSKVFPGNEIAVRDVDLSVEDGEFLVIVGPSGSGKSTLLRLVAGLERVSEGRILLDGRDVTDVPPRDRDLAMVFQSYALYPHKTVRENLAFGLEVRGADAARISRRVDEVARALEIHPLLDRKPGSLSGGQQQRVALGRAIAREPRAFLLDEPLSNLDPALRVRTRSELARLQRRLNATVLYVTHDQEEAMTLGQRVAVLHRGKVQQVAAPDELYERPANRFVAEFIGSPAMNVLRCRVRRDAGGPVLEGPAGVRIGELPHEVRETLDAAAPATVDVGARPHDVELVGTGTAVGEGGDAGVGAGEVEGDGGDGDGAKGGERGTDGADAVGRVELVESLGRETRLHVALEDASRGRSAGSEEGSGRSEEGPARSGERPRWSGERDGLSQERPGRTDGAEVVVVLPGDASVEPDEAVRLRFRRDRLHFFDAEGGRRL